ncbi:MAG: hypothetical protein LBE31_01815, partial [Deltaproteobacteria bacterium]|jgi:hypothetical protein|nr:hypothetical protein [Deltaproteobacteria bacterium]
MDNDIFRYTPPPVVTGPDFYNQEDKPHLRLAKLQLVLSMSSKNKAKFYLEDITSYQEKIKECSEMISRARECKMLIPTGKDKVNYDMPADMIKYFENHKLSWGSQDDCAHNANEWDFNITSLTNYQETLMNATKQHTIYIEDFMGQYNSYLQGANTSIQQAAQVLAAIAKGQ